MRVSATTTVRATPDQVWAYITVPEHGPSWQEGAVWTKVTTPGPVGLGSSMDHLGRWLGFRIPTRAVVSVFDEPRRYGYDITSRVSSRPAAMRYELEAVNGGTRLTLSNEAELPPLLRPATSLLRRSAQGMFERDVERLRLAIEREVDATVEDHDAAPA